MSEIVYARVRDIISPNSTFVGQSGMHSIKFEDNIPEEAASKKQSEVEQMVPFVFWKRGPLIGDSIRMLLKSNVRTIHVNYLPSCERAL